MATRTPKEITIPTIAIINRVAWHEWQGQHNEANAIRQLCAECSPVHRVDEAAVTARLAELRRAHNAPARLD